MATPRQATLDLSRPPFCIPEGRDARSVAEDFIACFETVARLQDRVSTCFDAALQVAGLARNDPLCAAGAQIARDMDAGVGAGGDNPYHNAQHFCEVLLSALYLSLLAGTAPRGRVQLLIAALAHDFHHDGTTNRDSPFRLERRSAEATSAYLESAGVPAEERAHISAMILATEVPTGTRFARDCYLHFAEAAPRPSLEHIPEPLTLLAADPDLATQAVIVGEADILSSAGLTVQYGEMQQDKLAEEWKQPLGADHKLRFLDQVIQDFTVGRFFSPNLRELKSAAQDRAAQERPPRRSR